LWTLTKHSVFNDNIDTFFQREATCYRLVSHETNGVLRISTIKITASLPSPLTFSARIIKIRTEKET